MFKTILNQTTNGIYADKDILICIDILDFLHLFINVFKSFRFKGKAVRRKKHLVSSLRHLASKHLQRHPDAGRTVINVRSYVGVDVDQFSYLLFYTPNTSLSRTSYVSKYITGIHISRAFFAQASFCRYAMHLLSE